MAKVMVVDDDGFMRMVLKSILTRNGHEVVKEARDGKDSIKIYQEHKPDVVFMDIVMPNMEGTTALKKIIDVDPGANVVMCSSIGKQSIIKEAVEIGAKDFIVKPFEAEKVLDVVDKLS